MYPEKWKGRLENILEAINNLQSYIKGMTYQEFASDRKTIRASTYEIMVIGEAARYVPGEIRKKYPLVPWEKMQSIRNVVVHEYFQVDTAILWQTITKNLPPLVPVLQEILRKEK